MATRLTLITVALGAAVIFYGCEKCQEDKDHGPANSEPTADFTYVISDPATRTVTFTNKSSNADEYSWKFGDNTSASSLSPQHAYSSSGEYTVSLTASGKCGEANTISKTVAINPY